MKENPFMSTAVSKQTPLNIISADILIADEILSIDDSVNGSVVHNDALASLVKKYGFRPGSKYVLNEEQCREFRSVYDGSPKGANYRVVPGGSSANVLTTVSNLLGKDVKGTFLGINGGAHKDMIQKSLDHASITVLPDLPDGGEPAESATSFVIIFPPTEECPKGQRAIATYPGNAKKLLHSSVLTQKIIEEQYAVLVQGSLWQKLEETPAVPDGYAPDEHLGFADKMLKLRWECGKELWLCMPTQADFSTIKRAHADKVKYFQDLIRSANVVLGNDEEIARVYTNDEEYNAIMAIQKRLEAKQYAKLCALPENATQEQLNEFGLTQAVFVKYNFKNKSIKSETAFERLQAALHERFFERSTEWIGENKKQIAFITCGPGKPGKVITADHAMIDVPPAQDPKEGVTSTLGAGDTAFAGFLSAYIKLCPQHEVEPDQCIQKLRTCGEIGMTLAGEKLKENAARLEKPREALECANPCLAAKLFTPQPWSARVAGGNRVCTVGLP